MAALARWCVTHRLLVVLLWLLALGGVSGAAAVAGTAYSDDYEVPGTESGRATALLATAFPGLAGDSDTIVWHTERGSVRDAGIADGAGRMLARVAGLPGVSSVTGPYGADGAGQISADGRTAYARVAFDRPADELPVSRARALVETATSLEAAHPGLAVDLGGGAVARTEATTDHTAEIVGVAVAAVVLFVVFGSLAAGLLPLATALVSVGTAYAGIALLGHVMTVAEFAPVLGLLIGLGVGIDYALFIVVRHRKGLLRGLTVPEAAANAVATTGRAVVFAGATVCVALLGLLILRLGFLNGVAIAASLTVVLTVAAAVTLLPALLSYIGERVLRRRDRRGTPVRGPRAAEAPWAAEGPSVPAEGTSGTARGRAGPAVRWSHFVERHPRLLGALAAAVMVVLALPTAALHLGTSDQGNNPPASTTRQAYDRLAQGFGPGVNGPLTLVAHLEGAADRLAMDRLPGLLRTTEGVASVSPAVFNGSADTALLTVVPATSPQSRQTSELVDRLRTRVLPEASAGTSLTVYVGGVTASYDDFAGIIVGKLPLFVGVVIALGCLLLLLAFRSVGIPLKAALMNVAAVASSFGVVVAIFQWGWGSELMGLGSPGPIEPFLPVIMVSVLFGLSMDYQVFLVSRMYEEWLATGDNARAVRVGLSETGRVINSAAVIMISVFLAFVLSGDRVIAMFGVGLATAVALDAFLLRTLLVPALMHLLGGANWWLPGFLERRLPRISIEPPERHGRAKMPVPKGRGGENESAGTPPLVR
ncbi:MMPL family transporter [Streptomyces sp. NPDC093085]|uniref:MMPL family transporter n=1 Tax=Streptomyces sp. NPDC093085 TaxID=3155068 RepID=UPI0034328B73